MDRASATPDLHDTAWMAVQSIQSSASAKLLLAKDLMLLLLGIRASVLVDYLSPKSISKDLLAVIKRGKTMRDEFNLLQLAQLCDGNFLLIHLHNLTCRLSESIDSNLMDYLFIDCSASLACPILLTPDSTDSLLLPAFRSVLQHLRSGDGEGVLHLHGEESGAPLPTLGGWLLEYPVVYYVAGSPGPHHHAHHSSGAYHLFQRECCYPLFRRAYRTRSGGSADRALCKRPRAHEAALAAA